MGWLRTSALVGAAVLCGSAGAASAQAVGVGGATPAPTSQPAVSPDPKAPVAVQEIVVTAQKRSQSLQDVPISIAAVTGATLEQRRISDFSELQNVVPGITFNGSNTPRGSGIAVRGIGTVSYSEGIEGSVGIVLDGVPIGRQGAGFTDLADLERVEVLRGPQGTLFGKNASAGVINIVTRRPTKFWTADGGVSFGEDRDTKIRANISGPLDPGGRIRGMLSGYYTHRDGYIFDVHQGRSYNGRNEYGVRAKLDIDITERINLLLTGDYTDRDVPCCMWTTRDYSSPTNAIALTQKAAGIVAGPDNLQVNLSGKIFQRQQTQGVTTELNWKLPGGFTLTNIAAIRGWHEIDNNDADQTPLNLLDVNQGNIHQHQTTEELRLASPSGKRIEFVAGVFYFNQSTGNRSIQEGTLGAPFLIGRQAFLKTNTDNVAAFGDVTFRVTDQFRIFGGLRFSHETLDVFQTKVKPSTSFIIFPGNLAFPAGIKNSRTDDSTTWRVGAQYDFARRIMAYVTVARGFKAGGFNVVLDNNALNPVEPEVPTNYEAGLKTELFERRLMLNVSGFYEEFENFQAQTIVTTAAGLAFDLRNAGRLISQGVELDFSAAPMQGLTISGGATYLGATYDSFKGGACYTNQAKLEPTRCVLVAPGAYAQDLSGRKLPNTPEFAFNIGARYEAPLTGVGKGFVQGAYSWRDSVLTAQNQDPASRQSAFGLLDLSAGVQFPGGITVSIFGKNVSDQHYAEAIFETPLDSGSPTARAGHSQFQALAGRRTIGAAVDFRF